MTPGAFLVDIIPILKYVFVPLASFRVRLPCCEHMQQVMACDSSPFLGFLLDDRTYTFLGQHYYDPSFVTEGIREFQYSDSPNEDINKCCRPGVFGLYFPISLVTELYLTGGRYHCFGNRNFLFGDGLLS
jgi:hypothetical protein